MFILRTAFWMALILLLLPIDRDEAGISQGPTTFETFAAVGSVVSDLRGFCERNPSTCQTGAETVEVLRQKAVYSAGVVQGWLSEPGDTTIHVDHPAPRADMPTRDDVANLIEAATLQGTALAHPPL